MALTEQNGISIAEVAVYLPSLAIAVWLSIRHGFGRNAGWMYLIIFSLTRIVGAALQLATISDPNSISLYIGAATLTSIGLSPLILVQLGLVGRAVASIRKSTTSLLNETRLRLVQFVIVVGMILSAVGGSQAGTEYAKTGTYAVQPLAKAGLGLLVAGYVLTVLATVLAATQLRHIEAGEKRLLLAVGLSLPFLLVRLVYSAVAVFGGIASSNQLTPDIKIQLGMAVIMEMVVVAIVEGLGLTLKKIETGIRVADASPSGVQAAAVGAL